MAIARKCDRCGKFYAPFEESVISTLVQEILSLSKTPTQKHIETVVNSLDLCDECQKNLLEWFNNNTEGDNG